MERKDMLQAVVAALMFGEDAGYASTDTTMHVGGRCTVSVSEAARAIIAEAWAMASAVVPEERNGITRYDLTAI